jgi:RNA polymerase sigma-70 factor (ECF subfamily)
MAVMPSPAELQLVEDLRAGDETSFARLVDLYGSSMLRIARSIVGSRSIAEEVVQEAWLGVLRGLDRFEGRSSLKTWIFRILTNVAKTRAYREGRSVSFAELEGDEGPSVDPSRFEPAFGHWADPPHGLPESRLLAGELRQVVAAAIERLPPSQRTVISLRDVEGWSSEEVCNALELSETNQRVLLHRARTKVRRAIEEYVEER